MALHFSKAKDLTSRMKTRLDILHCHLESFGLNAKSLEINCNVRGAAQQLNLVLQDAINNSRRYHLSSEEVNKLGELSLACENLVGVINSMEKELQEHAKVYQIRETLQYALDTLTKIMRIMQRTIYEKQIANHQTTQVCAAIAKYDFAYEQFKIDPDNCNNRIQLLSCATEVHFHADAIKCSFRGQPDGVSDVVEQYKQGLESLKTALALIFDRSLKPLDTSALENNATRVREMCQALTEMKSGNGKSWIKKFLKATSKMRNLYLRPLLALTIAGPSALMTLTSSTRQIEYKASNNTS